MTSPERSRIMREVRSKNTKPSYGLQYSSLSRLSLQAASTPYCEEIRTLYSPASARSSSWMAVSGMATTALVGLSPNEMSYWFVKIQRT